jgi:anaerobic selenocysteine-containing dehydrogenase
MKVKVTDGVATEIQPNFDAEGIHPANGRCCVKAYGAVQKTYNPNRVLTPMKRSNPKKGRNEDPGFVPISWDEALDTICDRLKAIREKGLKDEAGLPRLGASTRNTCMASTGIALLSCPPTHRIPITSSRLAPTSNRQAAPAQSRDMPTPEFVA